MNVCACACMCVRACVRAFTCFCALRMYMNEHLVSSLPLLGVRLPSHRWRVTTFDKFALTPSVVCKTKTRGAAPIRFAGTNQIKA